MPRNRQRTIDVAVRFVLSVAIVLALLGSSPAFAQVVIAPRDRPTPQEAKAPTAKEATPLRSFVGITAAQRLLGSDDGEERLRGVARLSAIGTPEAIDKLVEALEQGTAIARDPRVRLEGVRALAAHALRDGVRQALVRELTDVGAEVRSSASPLTALTRGTAALALARAGDRKSIVALTSALLQPGPPADAAAAALRAYPPSSLQPILEGKKNMPAALVAFLGDLGDVRAIPRLRLVLEETDVPGRMAAALALAKLGDESPLALARSWLQRPDPRLQQVASQVLAELGAPDAPLAIAALLGGSSTRAEGLRLALAVPSPGLAKAIAAAIPELVEEDRARAVAALGRAGGPVAVQLLGGLMARPELSTPAAFALATMRGDAARGALERAALAAPPGAARRLVVRAGVVRALVLRDAPDGLDGRLEQMAASKDPADRALGAFGLVARGSWSVETALRGCSGMGEAAGKTTCDEVMVHAAAAAVLARGPAALRRLLPLLEAVGGDPPSTIAIAAGVALLAEPGGGAVPTSRLAAWAEAGGPLAPLAARALPSRDDDVLRGRIKRLLDGTDPVVRAHVALGLARDPEPDAVSMLTSAYRFEDDVGVRAAIVRALSRRTEVQRLGTLTLARDLDPDPTVRSLARSALAGRVLDHVAPATAGGGPLPPGALVAWVFIVANEASVGRGSLGRAARMVRADGLAVPLVAAPDGVALVPGLPYGTASLLLAPGR